MLGGLNTAQDSPAERGWYVRPTLFVDATNDMRIAREEIFGPVLTVLRYRDESDAVRIANESDYGLAGSVWTADIAHGLEIAASVRAGTYGINMYTLDIGSPFGGFKQSGIGREFGPEGLARICRAADGDRQREDATAIKSSGRHEGLRPSRARSLACASISSFTAIGALNIPDAVKNWGSGQAGVKQLTPTRIQPVVGPHRAGEVPGVH